MKMTIPNIVIEVAKAIQEKNGRALLVGGCVRDMHLNLVPKDIDLEVYGLNSEELRTVAMSFGEVKEVGRAFGILKLRCDELVIDLGIPRKDSKIDAGHKGFSVDVDPAMAPEQAARRRDFTVNAIMMNPLTGEVIDPFGGVDDLESRTLRVVDAETFGEDPLRVLRALQFCARFDLHPDEVSMQVLRSTVSSLHELSHERLLEEWAKLLVLSSKPSIGLQLGLDLGVYDELHPELPPLRRTPQNPAWHPEGDVWIHTLMVVDEAAAIIRREACDNNTKLMIMLAAVSHDLGKALCTWVIDGVIRSSGHEEAGEVPARSFLKAIGASKVMTEKIVGIVKEHLKPTLYYIADQQKGEPISDGTIRKLAARIAPATIGELLMVSEADYFGRGQWRHGEERHYPEREWLLGRARALEVLTGPAPHIISGEELMTLGIEPGPRMGEMIAEADRLRDDEGKTKEEIIETLFSK